MVLQVLSLEDIGAGDVPRLSSRLRVRLMGTVIPSGSKPSGQDEGKHLRRLQKFGRAAPRRLCLQGRLQRRLGNKIINDEHPLTPHLLGSQVFPS